MSNNLLILLIITLFINELNALACPVGTQTAAGAQQDDAIINCNHCKANFYYKSVDGTPFNAGASVCTPCSKNKAADDVPPPAAALGADATIVNQCNVSCPAGTTIANQSTNYVNAATECIKCAANFYYSGPNAFIAGTSICTPCPENGKKDFQLAISNKGDNATINIQCNVQCPYGTVSATGEYYWVQAKTDCVNCDVNFYFIGDAFIAGTNKCLECPSNKAQGVATAGSIATIILQCSLDCPDGTVLNDGKTTKYVADSKECVKCAANYYNQKRLGWLAGTDICIACNIKLTSGATAKLPSDATQATQQIFRI
ncbi:immobilization antigen isoform, putative [Ichthyophthirius multifiliis]|uniref:Immobilization antigen isoform, putative n=1 Tax=Ichthyophthirius multifiliis TaxID=5932 RepID=G0QQK2_ICHMU|nr:immobilization antigen isoform, putative [Ichthyophthirius multifiliis]EGR32503.1 immobilization antigen isoform, putative [Ichthyophthirius multifiliis]|eukprot:XP_004036489.1 immobilization antigen isoform, putative [Ichthyophthirius multifiliis]